MRHIRRLWGEKRKLKLMPKFLSSHEGEFIVSAVSKMPGGGSVDEINRTLKAAQPDFALPRRTLQRRLKMLVDSAQLRKEGEKRGVRYYAAAAEKSGAATAKPQHELSVSPSAAAIRDLMRGPTHLRKPAGYNHRFLDTCRPNETSYLSPKMRQHLARVGHAPDGELPAGTYARQILQRRLICDEALCRALAATFGSRSNKVHLFSVIM